MSINDNDISSAKRTIDREVESLRIMEKELDQSLTKALDLMQNTKGRVIVTGMGKSGHIGKKIAATLASTGTPSFFLTPWGSLSWWSWYDREARCSFTYIK